MGDQIDSPPETIIADNIRSIKTMHTSDQPRLNIRYVQGVFNGYQISFGDVNIGFGKNMKEAEKAATNFTLQLTKALLQYRAEQ